MYCLVEEKVAVVLINLKTPINLEFNIRNYESNSIQKRNLFKTIHAIDPIGIDSANISIL